MYHHGFEVGKYIRLERIIEDSKETYYEALNKSSQKWHSAEHNMEPWLFYFLGTINSAYREFENRALKSKPQKGVKTNIVMQAIDSQIGKFTISDIVNLCPGVSREMIKHVFKKLKHENKIVCLGKGRNAEWKKV